MGRRRCTAVVMGLGLVAAGLGRAQSSSGASAHPARECQVWKPIMTPARPATYFSYLDNVSEELPGVPLRPVYELPSGTQGCSVSAHCQVSCQFPDRFPWFVGENGADVTGLHPYRNPSRGSVSSQAQAHVRGIEFVGSFDGRATGSRSDYVWEVVFFHQQGCYTGGNEYGFRREAIIGAFQFYWSINSNCGLDDPTQTPPLKSVCRSTRGGGARIQESSGAVVLPASTGTKKYQAYIARDDADKKWKFVVKIFDLAAATAPWTLWVDPSAPGAWFPAPADPRAVFPIEELVDASGYVTIGIQRNAGTSSLAPDPASPPAVRAQSLSVATVAPCAAHFPF